MWLKNRISTDRKFELLQNQLDDLKREFRTVLQEWDATEARVSKVLRRIKRAEQAEAAREDGETVDDSTTLPLTTGTGATDRMARIRAQLAEKGRQ